MSPVFQGKKLIGTDINQFQWAYRIFILVCTELQYYQPISPDKIIRCMSSLDDIDKLIRCQDHLLSVIRDLEPVNEKVVEEARLGFILPTVRAYLRHHRIRYFRTINTVAQFLSKLQFRNTGTDEQDLQAFADFQKAEHPFDYRLADCLGELLPEIDSFEHDHWKFGPGASYEVTRHAGSAPKFSILENQPCNYATYRLLSRLGYRHWTPPVFDERISKAIAVPKSIKRKRIITVEKTYNSFATQALREVLLEYIKKTGLNIFIDDQSFNRTLALMGSANGQLVTIDMHAASDSVTLQLVRRVFKRTGLLPYLEDARATHCIIKGEKVAMQSWAGMGNACTFPIECIIFALVVEYVAKRRRSCYSKLYAIVGDDIVVHRSLCKDVIDILVSLGFEVNYDKTYIGDHPFRESCGIEAIGGYNVTPVRLSRQVYFDYTNHSVDSLMSVSNNLYDCGYKRAASAIRRWFRLKERGLPYVDNPDEYGMLIWDNPDNAHLKTRYNRDLQRIEVRIRDFSIRMTRGSDDYRYQSWLMHRWQREDKISQDLPDNGLPDIVEQIKVGSPYAMPRWRYVPLQH